MNKHILFIVENSPVPADSRVWSEARSAKEFGYEVTVICPKENIIDFKYEKINGIEIYRHPMPIEAVGKFGFLFEYLNALLWELFLSIKIFKKRPFHYIHAANPPDHVFLLATFYRPFGIKFIFDHHDIAPEIYFSKFCKKDFFYKILLLYEKLTFKMADIVISTNESYKRIAISRGRKKCKQVFVVRNGPDLNKITFEAPNKKWKDGLTYLVAYIGIIGNQERIDVLLRVVDYIVHKKKIKNIKFAIIGTGTDLSKMIDLSESLQIQKYVNFTGFIPYKQVYEIFATADICINPEYKDDFTDKSTMIKIMEYMAFGKPIIQFETKEGKVTAKGAAWYVKNNNEIDFAEAIVKLLDDPEKRKKMGITGKNRIEKELNWDIQKNYLRKAYEYLENCF